MIYNKITGTRPYLAHAPGKLEHIPFWEVMLKLSSTFRVPLSVDEDLSIITFNNGLSTHNTKPLGLFESFGVPCDVLGNGIYPWVNKVKLELLSVKLKELKTTCVLVADSSDVFILRKLVGLVKRFESFNCGAVFNAEKIVWPPDLDSEYVLFENRIHSNCYLNAGLWIARTDFACKVVDYALNLNPNTAHSGSEQVYYKNCYKWFYPQMQVDVNCNLFQGLNRVDDELQLFKPF